ncbi:MAG TPA: TolC family protein [Bryobacteraceae bacterium]|nr:TolC family protein [Bryobacteraceae bacterium]
MILWLLTAVPFPAQEPLSLAAAVRQALAHNPSIAAAAAGASAAEARIGEAHSGRLPKVNYSESFARSDNPVFVFSSLLTQHQFAAENFSLGPLNRPDALNNFQSQLSVDQVLYDGGRTKQAERAARLTHDISGEEGRRARMDVLAGVARAYYGSLLAQANLEAAQEAMRSAEADLKRAESIRAAGMSTDVDVLSIRVHLAEVQEQRIRRAADLDVARAALNDALGLPLDVTHSLTTRLEPADLPDISLAEYERGAVAERPEARQVKFGASLAESQIAAARTALLPEVGVRAAFEEDRQRFIDRGGANWLAAVSMQWNLFNGFADRARIAAATQGLRHAEAERERAGSGIRLEVRRAYADLRAAQQRIEVAKAAAAEAQESLRITQNRYQAGLGGITDLLRTESAALDSRTRYLAAVHDQRVAAVVLELAAGRLSEGSEALRGE